MVEQKPVFIVFCEFNFFFNLNETINLNNFLLDGMIRIPQFNFYSDIAILVSPKTIQYVKTSKIDF